MPREEAYAALIDPGRMGEWWGPNGFTIPEIDFAPRVGAGYRIAMQPPDGELFHLSGEFREVDPPARLAYTFRWDPPAEDDQETLATISLEEAARRPSSSSPRASSPPKNGSASTGTAGPRV